MHTCNWGYIIYKPFSKNQSSYEYCLKGAQGNDRSAPSKWVIKRTTCFFNFQLMQNYLFQLSTDANTNSKLGTTLVYT